MKTTDILIGIDVGSTVLKAAAFSAQTGRAIACHSERLKLTVPAGGGREQSPEGLDRAWGRSMRSLRGSLGKRWGSVAGIGLAAQGGSAIVADRRTGKALTPMLMWNDARAKKHAAVLNTLRPKRFWNARTWRDVPGHGLAKMLWLRAQNPELFLEDNIYVGAGEYVYFGLTETWKQDACNALQIGCYNVPLQKLDEDLLGLIDVPLSFVAPLRAGHESQPLAVKTARRFGLREGIPIVGPYMDHEAGYMSASNVSRNPLQCSLGTAWVGNFQFSPAEQSLSSIQLVIPAVVGKGWLNIQPLLAGNVAWDWGLKTFLHKDHDRALGLLDSVFSEALLPASGLAAMPWRDTATGFGGIVPGEASFFSVRPVKDDHEKLRALAASMVFEMTRVFSDIHANQKIDSVVLGGGASKGSFFRSLFAALFAPLPVYSLKEEDLSGARGSLQALSRKVAKAEMRKVPVPGPRTAEGTRIGFERYLEQFSALYGDPSAVGTVRLKRRNKEKQNEKKA